MWTVLTLLFFLTLLGSLIGLIFKKARRQAMWVAVVGFIGLATSAVFVGQEVDEAARQKGFLSAADLRNAQQAGVTDASEWKAQQEKVRAAELAALEVKRKAAAEAEARRKELLQPPDQQLRFVSAVERARAAYKNGQNELQKGAARPARARDLCSTSSSQVNNWIGTIASLSTNGDGDGVLSVKIADKLHLVTWNNSFSDIGTRTLIKSNTSLYQDLLKMKSGALVRVYGQMFSSEQDCYRETSITMQGSLEDPTFLLRFSRVEPVILP